MQIESAVCYPFNPHQMAKNFKLDNDKYWWGSGIKGHSHLLLVRRKATCTDLQLIVFVLSQRSAQGCSLSITDNSSKEETTQAPTRSGMD